MIDLKSPTNCIGFKIPTFNKNKEFKQLANYLGKTRYYCLCLLSDSFEFKALILRKNDVQLKY